MSKQTNSENLFQAIGVEKTFFVKSQNITVLRDINMHVKKNEFLVIFGPSGCGKSTLLHTLLGLEPPTKGDVLFYGNSLYDQVDEDSRAQMRKKYVGMVYQQPNWIKALSVKENVMVPLRLSGYNLNDARMLADQVLQRVEMNDWEDYIPTELSSGQQQKVALARAVVSNPEIIIADEPTGNLDFESGQELMQLLGTLHKSGKTVIMVTHDLEYLSYSQRALQMFDGQIVNEITQPHKYVSENQIGLKRGKGNGDTGGAKVSANSNLKEAEAK